jgi:hypothetical protein
MKWLMVLVLFSSSVMADEFSDEAKAQATYYSQRALHSARMARSAYLRRNYPAVEFHIKRSRFFAKQAGKKIPLVTAETDEQLFAVESAGDACYAAVGWMSGVSDADYLASVDINNAFFPVFRRICLRLRACSDAVSTL